MAYNRTQKHRNQSDTSTRNHDFKKKHFTQRPRLTREDYQIPGCPTGIKVPTGSSIEQALRRFKKMMKQTDILGQLRERREFIKPSKQRYEARKRSTGMERKNSLRSLEYDKNHVWTAIIDGQAQ